MSAFASLTTVTRIAGPALPAISFAARLPAAICPIATLLMLTELNSIGTAGIAAGMLWTGQAVGGPFLGRYADRRGHRPVILAASLANATAVALFVVSALTAMPLVVQAALAAVAGLTVPQIGPLSRTRWIVLTDPKDGKDGKNPSSTRDARELTRRALSFDTTVDELSFMAGPALAGVTVVLIHPAAGLVLAGLVMTVFGTLFALHPTAPPGTPPRTSAHVRLLHPALLALFAMALLQGMIWGSANAGTSALSAHLGDTGTAGLVWGAMAVTSALTGLAITMRPIALEVTLQLRLAIVAQTLLLLPLLLVDSFLGATAAIAAIGFAVAPHLIAVFTLAEQVAPMERMGEAMTFLGSGLIVGQGVAALAAGQLAQHHGGHPSAFLLTCASGAVAVLVALTLVRPGTISPYRAAHVPEAEPRRVAAD
ncbi:MFS transporter [Streptomyces durocortorensis]|uniref:MFS transporter n=1 Tax=Streptomyces durocortorensis TaxID=2811104 RepID=A0ABS2I234_9ACTN|nr:MFS transporter [Streptomyces durocortorensis]MBM7057032.1 MFS transporter [Streptomyces durocortorensis]